MDAKNALTFTPGAVPFGRAVVALAFLAVVCALSAPRLAAAQTAPAQTPPGQGLPADDAAARKALEAASRHGEYVDIDVPGSSTPLRAFVVYPERPDKAPVVLVVHEVFGLSDLMRGVADRLAAEGFIAIAVEAKTEIPAAVAAARAYGNKLPAANGKSMILFYGPTGKQLASSGVSGYSIEEVTVEAMHKSWPAMLASLRLQLK